MKKTPVFYIRTSLVVVGFLFVLLGGFTEFQSTCDYVDETTGIIDISIQGIKAPLWYFFFIGSSLIFLIGSLSNSSIEKGIVYTISILLSLYISFVTWLSTGGWGKPCGETSSYGYYLSLLGSLLILTATIIFMHRKRSIQQIDNDLTDKFFK